MRGAVTKATVVLVVVSALALGDSHAFGQSTPTRTEVEEAIRRAAIEDFRAGSPAQPGVAMTAFQEKARAVHMELDEVAAIYRHAYLAEKEHSKASPWDEYTPKLPWIVALLAILAAVFHKKVEELLSKSVDGIGAFVHRRFAGSRLLRRSALKRYKRGLRGALALLRVPFRPDRPLSMRDVYVPLRVVRSHHASQSANNVTIDARAAIAGHKRLIILGAPGAGKSMLMRHIAYSFSEERGSALARTPLPVLIELHRLTDPSKKIEEEVVESLERFGFPGARGFAERNLESGHVLLLLDGLDEVIGAHRARVVQMIKDFAHRHSATHLVLTCRTAVYKGELDEIVDQKLELIDFDDHQIARYLRTWAPTMRETKSVDELLNALADRPQIKALARNPLLLTIIAYLYADTDLVLPHSRSEFYRHATDQLLDRWQNQLNRYQLAQKRVVLEHLAMLKANDSAADEEDHRTIDFRAVIAEIRRLCPSIGAKEDEDEEILKEIVERSGLLLAIDGGQRYAFAHLTLQEYFTAAHLQSDADQLVDRFRADQDAWRETVKLWCGLANDCTAVVRAIRDVELVTAFECLADARKIDGSLVDRLIDDLKQAFEPGNPGIDRILHAFGTVAADPRRGTTVLAFLAEALGIPERRQQAAQALARTNLTRAAELLAQHLGPSESDVRKALVAMGDVAVPVLIKRADAGYTWAIDDLQTIATPRVAEALTPLLWGANWYAAVRAGLALASLLRDPMIEAALRERGLSVEQRASKDIYDWLWKPFEERESSSLRVIVGRIGFLIDHANPEDLSGDLDVRILLGLAVNRWTREADTSAAIAREVAKDREKPMSPLGALTASQTAFQSKTLRKLIDLMPGTTRARLVEAVLVGAPRPNMDDWSSVVRPSEYVIQKGWHIRAYVATCALVALPGLIGVIDSIRSLPLELTWRALGMIVVAFALLGIVLSGVAGVLRRTWFHADDLSRTAPMVVASAPALVAIIVGEIVGFRRGRDFVEDFATAVFGVLFSVGMCSWILAAWWWGAPTLTIHFVPLAARMFWIGAGLLGASCWILAFLAEAASKNPLKGVLALQKATDETEVAGERPIRFPLQAFTGTPSQ